MFDENDYTPDQLAFIEELGEPPAHVGRVAEYDEWQEAKEVTARLLGLLGRLSPDAAAATMEQIMALADFEEIARLVERAEQL